MCVMQEGNEACEMSGCALQESITVSSCTGKLKLKMTRDYVQLKSVKFCEFEKLSYFSEVFIRVNW